MASSEKRPRKGILKTSTSFDSNEHHSKNKEMTWDEMNIIATHHPPDKDYGHMKIDEPPTPYSKCSDPEDDDEEGIGERRGSVGDKAKLDAKSLSSRLEDIEAPTRRRRVSTEEDVSSDDEEEEELTEEEKEHRQKFEQKRKIHYNEFQAVKLAKQLMEEEDDDDADEEDETGDNGSNTQDSVQMQTDQSPSTDSSTGATITAGVQKVSGSSASGQSKLAETTMDAAGHLETQIN